VSRSDDKKKHRIFEFIRCEKASTYRGKHSTRLNPDENNRFPNVLVNSHTQPQSLRDVGRENPEFGVRTL
jgi:hypothetical protein